jgi:uncharacterized membrane protein YhaH (DUF805 family)
MLALEKPLKRGNFLALGVALFAAKVVLDAVIAAAFARPFSLAFYIDPFASLNRPDANVFALPLESAQPGTAYFLTVIGVSLPFLLAGVAIVIRRLRDAGLPPPLALFFFVPLLKFLFFAALAAVPSKRPAGIVRDDAGPFRSAEIVIPPTSPSPRRAAKSRRRVALLFGTLSGASVGLLAIGFSVFLMRDYGPPLMMGAPAVAGFVSTWVYSRLHAPTLRATLLVTFLAFAAGLVGLGASAIEGFACMVMGAPLFYGETLIGGLLAFAIARSIPVAPPEVTSAGLAILPVLFAVHAAAGPAPEASSPVESAVIVHAPADLVWNRVIAFPPLAPAHELVFRAGVAAPVAATIEGQGPGAIRRCEFTTGTFVEPIEAWVPGRKLAFSVASQPDPMREWTLHAGPRPPHLDGYLQSTRGEFALEPLPDGSTRLVGRTWYRVHMAPVPYWRLWGDAIIHAIHLRVLRHVAALAEQDAQAVSMRNRGRSILEETGASRGCSSKKSSMARARVR